MEPVQNIVNNNQNEKLERLKTLLGDLNLCAKKISLIKQKLSISNTAPEKNEQ